MKKKLFLFTLLSIHLISAQSPSDLTSNIGQDNSYWFTTVSTISDIENAYNNARRLEETKLSLTTNSLGTLTLPSDWNSKTGENKVLYLLNEERKIRGGINYGNGAVLGLPFEGIETNIDNLAQAHADDQLGANTFSHTGSDNSSPFERINDDLIIGNCNQFISYAENISAFWSFGGTNQFVAERAVYNWIYEDASSAWGHRRAVLIQNSDSYGGVGFTNDNNEPTSEGYIGVGFASSASYNPFSFSSTITDADLVVLNIFDPNATCNYPLLIKINQLENKKNTFILFPNPATNKKINLVFQNTFNEKKGTLSITNLVGLKMFEQKIYLNSGKNTIKIDLPNLKPSIYLAIFKTTNIILTKKLILED
jgi:uncharacterized protein YkwD